MGACRLDALQPFGVELAQALNSRRFFGGFRFQQARMIDAQTQDEIHTDDVKADECHDCNEGENIHVQKLRR